MLASQEITARCPDRGTLSIEDVNSLLDDVATGHASKDISPTRKYRVRVTIESHLVTRARKYTYVLMSWK